MSGSSKEGPLTLVVAVAAAGFVTATCILVTRHSATETALKRHSAKLQSLDHWKSQHVVACSPNVTDDSSYGIALISQAGGIDRGANIS